MTRRARDLLEPGALLGGALLRDLLASGAADAWPPGTRLGAYRIVRELGRGGMGVVHLAERADGEFAQQVALKCLAERGSAANTELFRRERQILAGLRHPNIARLLDGGSDEGLLWFAMEWVEGERIDRHCRRHALPLDARLRLWLGIAEAVQFAHARLLIHRDIKPGNVLIDADGRPRLLDFGIAALLGDGDSPRAYSPGHASPEQLAGGEVGTASDQFQLGLLLTGLLMRDGDEDAAHTGSDRAPAPAAAPTASPRRERWIAMPAVRRRELSAVLDRACAEDPAARYGSVAELRADVERLLERRPVDALRGRWPYAFACAVRRRPVTAAVVTLAALSVVALVLAFNARLARERDLARAETAKVRAINAFVSDDLLASADPFTASQPDLRVREALDRALVRVGTRFADQPAIESELRRTLGATYAGIGELSLAGEQLDRAYALRRQLAPADDPDAIGIVLQQARRDLADSDYAAAQQRLESLIGVLEASGDGGDALIAARISLLDTLSLAGRLDEAGALDATLTRTLQTRPDDDALKLDHADTRGHLWLLQGHAEAAAELFDATAASRAAQDGPDDYRRLRSLEGKARALRDGGRQAEAIAVLRDLHARRLAVFGAEHPETLRNHNELAVALSQNGDRATAIEIWIGDLAIKQRRLGPSHSSTLSTRYNLANELLASRRYADAETAFRALLEAERAARGAGDPGAWITQMSLANAIGRQDRHDEALGLLDALLDDPTALAGRPERAIALVYRSRTQAALGHGEAARADARAAVTAFEATVGSDHRRTVQAREWLASLEAPAAQDATKAVDAASPSER